MVNNRVPMLRKLIFPLRGIVQAGHRAKDGGEDQRHNNHLQQLDVTVADDIEPLDGILQHWLSDP